MKKKSIYIFIVAFLTSCNTSLDFQNISGEIKIHPTIIIPIGSVSTGITQIASIDTSLHVEPIPEGIFTITFKNSQYTLIDTVPNFFIPLATTLDSYKDAEFSFAQVNLEIINGLPVNAKLQIVAVDINGLPIETSFKEKYALSGSKTDANGFILAGTEVKQTLTIYLNNSQVQELRKAQNLVYKVEINVPTVNSKISFTKSELFSFKAGFYGAVYVTTNIRK